MNKTLSQAAIRREVGAALRPIKDALHARTEEPSVPTVELRGFRFSGVRMFKAPGQAGFVWMPHYKGCDKRGRLVFSGTLAQVSDALYWRLQSAQNCRAEWDGVNDPPCHPGDDDWQPCVACKPANVRAKPGATVLRCDSA